METNSKIKTLQAEIQRRTSLNDDLAARILVNETKAGALEDFRREFSLAAFEGDKVAQKRLQELNEESVVCTHESANLQFALEENDDPEPEPRSPLSEETGA